MQNGSCILPDVLAGAPKMTTRAWLPVAAAGILLTVAACGSNPKPQVQPAAVPAQRTSAPADAPPPPDPIATLIATSQKHFEAGERELKVGHLEGAY